MTEEHTQPPERAPQTLAEYMTDSRVVGRALQFLGGQGDTWSEAGSIASAYLGVGTIEKAFAPDKHSPISTIPPEEITHRLQGAHGMAELYTSLLQKDSETEQGVPRRILFHWDIDKFVMLPDNNYDEAAPIRDVLGTFGDLENAYAVMRDYLRSYGIMTLDVMSGKGMHLYTQVDDPELMRKIEEIGGPVEDTVAGKLATVHRRTKSPGPVPLYHQQAFQGACRLQQYVISQVIEKARAASRIDVEIWDKNQPGLGREGLAFDNTAALAMCNSKPTGVPGSPYIVKPARAGVQSERIRLQLPISGIGFDNKWRDVLEESWDFARAATYLGGVNTTVPDANEGMKRLIDEYMQSDLRKLHEAMDASFGDDPSTFATGYRNMNYEGIIGHTHDPEFVKNVIMHANPMLVQLRYDIDRFIYQVFEAMGGSRTNLAPAPHVAGLLRAIYEDPQFGWGKQWMKNVDALHFARGEVEMALGQMFERENTGS